MPQVYEAIFPLVLTLLLVTVFLRFAGLERVLDQAPPLLTDLCRPRQIRGWEAKEAENPADSERGRKHAGTMTAASSALTHARLEANATEGVGAGILHRKPEST